MARYISLKNKYFYIGMVNHGYHIMSKQGIRLISPKVFSSMRDHPYFTGEGICWGLVYHQNHLVGHTFLDQPIWVHTFIGNIFMILLYFYLLKVLKVMFKHYLGVLERPITFHVNFSSKPLGRGSTYISTITFWEGHQFFYSQISPW